MWVQRNEADPGKDHVPSKPCHSPFAWVSPFLKWDEGADSISCKPFTDVQGWPASP